MQMSGDGDKSPRAAAAAAGTQDRFALIKGTPPGIPGKSGGGQSSKQSRA